MRKGGRALRDVFDPRARPGPGRPASPRASCFHASPLGVRLSSRSSAVEALRRVGAGDRAIPPPRDADEALLRRAFPALCSDVRALAAADDIDVDDLIDMTSVVDGDAVRAAAGSLCPDDAARLLGALRPRHAMAAPREVLHLLAGLPEDLRAHTPRALLEALPFDTLRPADDRALALVLRALPRAALEELMASASKGRAVRGKLTDAVLRTTAPAPSDVERARNRTAALAALRDRGALEAATPATQAAIAALRAELTGKHPNARRALALVEGVRGTDPNQMPALVHVLEAEGLVDRLLGAAQRDLSRVQGPARAALRAVLAEREPHRNVAFAEDLTEPSFLFGNVDGDAAEIAYELVTALPVDVLARVRRRDGGAWLLHIERSLPRAFVASPHYRGYPRVSGDVDDRDVDAEAHALVAATTAALARDPMAGLDALTAVDDEDILRLAVRRLDAGDTLGPMLGKIGFDKLFHDDHRAAAMRVLAVRDPVHLREDARALVARGFFDMPFGSPDAFMALHLLQALPHAELEAFLQERGGKYWDKIKAAVVGRYGERDTISLYGAGPETHADRASLRRQLLDDRAWLPGNGARLSSLLQMARAAGDHAWLFAESARRGAWRDHDELARRFELFHPTERPVFTPPALEAPNRILDAILTPFDSFLMHALETLFTTGSFHLARYVGCTGLNLTSVEKLARGGGVSMRFHRHEDMGAAGREALARRAGVNFIDVRFEPKSGTVHIEAPEVRLAALSAITGDQKILTGDGHVRGLKVEMHRPTARDPRPAYVSVTADHAHLDEIVLITPGGMRSIKSLDLEDVVVSRSTSGVEMGAATPRRNEELPIPVPIVGHILGGVLSVGNLLLGGTPLPSAALDDSGVPTTARIGEMHLEGLAESTGKGSDHVRMHGVVMSTSAQHGGYEIAADHIDMREVRSAQYAKRLVLDDLQAKVTGAPLAARILDDARLLDAFLDDGGVDDVEDRSQTGHLEIRRLYAEELQRLPEIPSLATHDAKIAAWRAVPAAKDIDGAAAARVVALEALRPKLARLHALEARGLHTLSTDEEAEARALQQECLEPPPFVVGKLVLKDTTLTSRLEAGNHKAVVEHIDALDVRTASADLDEVHADHVVVEDQERRAPLGAAVKPAHMRLDVQRLQVERLRTPLPQATGARVAVDEAVLEDAALEMQGRPVDEALELLLVSAKRGGFDGVSVTARLPGADAQTVDATAALPAGPARPVVLEPLGGLDGRVAVTSELGASAGALTAHVDVEIEDGGVPADRVRASVGTEAGGVGGMLRRAMLNVGSFVVQNATRVVVEQDALRVRVPGVWSYTLAPADVLEGLDPERTPNGRIDVRRLAEAKLSPRPATASTTPGDAPTGDTGTAAKVMQLQVDADVTLGAGHVALPMLSLDLDEAGQRVRARGALGDLAIEADALRASRIAVDAGMGIQSAALGAEDIAVRVQSGDDARVVTLRVQRGTVQDVEIAPAR